VLDKPPGTVRILAIGGSSTFGVTNPDWATWPAFLQEALRTRYGARIEVLNGGRPGGRLGSAPARASDAPDLLQCLSASGRFNGGRPWLDYQPDIVIFYEAFNNCPANLLENADRALADFHRQSRLGRFLSRLHYRSMLYTYLVEKIHFEWLARFNPVYGALKRFREKLDELARLVRSHGATPVFVLQLLKYPEEPSVRTLALNTDEEIRAFAERMARVTARDPSEQKDRLWGYVAQVFVEAVRREGETIGVQVIDPRRAFAADTGAATLHRDLVHLTDEGNKFLAEEIADALDL